MLQSMSGRESNVGGVSLSGFFTIFLAFNFNSNIVSFNLDLYWALNKLCFIISEENCLISSFESSSVPMDSETVFSKHRFSDIFVSIFYVMA